MAVRKIKIEINHVGVGALLKSREVGADIYGRGERVLAAMPKGDGEEWAINNAVGHDRVYSLIATKNFKAKETASSEPHRAISALNAGR